MVKMFFVIVVAVVLAYFLLLNGGQKEVVNDKGSDFAGSVVVFVKGGVEAVRSGNSTNGGG